jgi:peptidyl-prolyl cis-trans isomerase C
MMKKITLSKSAAVLLSAAISTVAIAQTKPAPQLPPVSTTATAAAAAPVKKTFVVNGVTIPQSRYDAIAADAKSQGAPDTPELHGQIRDELITREVLFQAATKQGLEKKPEVVQQLELARQGILARAFVDNHTKSNAIPDAEYRKQYDEMKKQMGDNEYKARHILVEKEDEAKAIIADLNKGGDFAKLAKDKTKDSGSKDNGGDLDWGPAGRYVAPFGNALKALKKGETTSAPVKSEFGFHVIRLDDVRPMKFPSFEEMKPNFQQRAQQEQVAKLIQDLKSRAKVEER